MARNNSQQFQAQFSLNSQDVTNKLDQIKKGIEDVDKAMQSLDKNSKDYKDTMQKLAEQRKALQQEQREWNSLGKVVKDLMKDLDKASPNQLKQTMRDINKAIDQGAIKRGTEQWKEAMQILAKCDQELKKINAEIAAAGEKSAFSKLRDQVSALVNNFKNLEKQSYSSLKKMRSEIQEIVNRQEPGSRGFQKWTQRLRDVDAQMKKVEADMKGINKENKEIESNHKNGGFWSGLFKGGLAKAAGLLSGTVSTFLGVKKVFGDIYNLSKEFEQQMANLASVLGKSKDEVKDLEQQALRLGETTMFTASQVAGLQINLAKLGFDESQIKNSTRSILDFAVATGAALPEAASVAGAALRAFDLDSSQMSRVVSTMAVATTKSALDFEKLRTSISITFPVAKTFGFTIEDTTALLGKLSDAGFEASSAATATRNILLNMANPAGKLAKALGAPIRSIEDLAPALQKLRDRGIDLAEAFALTDKRSVAAFTRFVQVSDQLVDMKKSITDADEALRKMVETRMNTLEGSIIQLNSAWQNLMLSFKESTGPMKDVVDWLTDLTRSIARLMGTIQKNDDKEIANAVDTIVEQRMKKWNEFVDMIVNDSSKTEDQQLAMFDKWAKSAEKQREKLVSLRNSLKAVDEKLDKGEYGGALISKDKLNEERQRLAKAIVQAEVDIRMYQQYMSRFDELTAKKKNGSPFQKDPFAGDRQSAEGRIAAEQKLEIEAYAQRKIAAKENNEDLEKIEMEHAQKMHDIAVAVYADIADKYRTLDPKQYEIYTNKIEQAGKKLAAEQMRIMLQSMAARNRADKQNEKSAKQRETEIEKLNNKLETSARKEESLMAKLTSTAQKYEGVIEDDEPWRNRQKRAVNALKNEAAALTRTYNEAHRILIEEMQNKLQLADLEGKSKLEIEMEYLTKSIQLREQYDHAIEANERATNATIAANSKETWKKVAGYIQDAISEVSGLFDAYSELVSSKYALQEAQVESRYDKEIEAAEKAGRDTTKLEKQKEEAIKAIQLQEAEAEYKASIAQAQMNAATASIRLWADNPWFVAAPLQAVLAAEVGMQMATLKSQYDAKKVALQGYYDGGYTGYNGNYRQVAGVTHEGEFVANHKTVNNPEIRPMLDLLDYAQKHNAEARLTQKDLAMAAAYRQGGYYGGGYAGGTPTVNVSPNVTVQRDDNYARMTQLLDMIYRNGIDANVYIDDVNKAQKKKIQLLNNKSRIA